MTRLLKTYYTLWTELLIAMKYIFPLMVLIDIYMKIAYKEYYEILFSIFVLILNIMIVNNITKKQYIKIIKDEIDKEDMIRNYCKKRN